MLSTGLANTNITCSSIELSHFNPRIGQTCAEYMHDYISLAGGYVNNPEATQDCQFCYASDTNVYLTGVSASYANRWRDFGIMWAFIIFNVIAALFLYWLARVPKKQKVQDEPDMHPASRVQSRATRTKSG